MQDSVREIFVLPEEASRGVFLSGLVEVGVTSNGQSAPPLSFVDKDHIVIGSHEDADIWIQSAHVARQHAEIRREGAMYVLRSLQPNNPCILADLHEPITDSQPLSQSTNVLVHKNGPRISIDIGLVIPFGEYQLTGRLGGGGMAEVFLARQRGIGGFNRRVAIKLIQPHLFKMPNAERMFLEEARIAADLNHHNVVRIYDVGKHGGTLFIAMEYLQGLSVYDIYNSLAERNLRMAPDLAAALLAQASAGLHAMHELRDSEGRPMNVVHRDVSHSNLMCTPEGIIKVIDFGLAKDNRGSNPLSDPKLLKGKPSYMSPEQINGQPLDRRSDIWALGVMLFELCTGRSLFTKDAPAATLYAVMTETIPTLSSLCSGISPRLEQVVKKALQRNRDDRYANSSVLAADLRDVVKEYGGQFLSTDSISQYLTQAGVALDTRKVPLLTEVPLALRGEVSGKPRDDIKPKSAPLYVDTPESLQERTIADGRYKLLRYTGELEQVGSVNYRLTYIASVLAQPLAAQPGDRTKPALDRPILVSLIGTEKELKVLSPENWEKLAEYVRLRQLLHERRIEGSSPVSILYEHGLAWPGGPAYVAYPLAPSTLSSHPVLRLSTAQRLALVLELCATFRRALRLDPNFVHGRLRPQNVGLPSEAPASNLTIQGFSAAQVLRMKPIPREPIDPYLAPECSRGELPTPKSDVYSLGVMMFGLLGGDIGLVAERLQQRMEPPRLPPDRELAPHVEPAVLSALRPDPQLRPSIDELFKQLQPPPSPPPLTIGGDEISPPAPGSILRMKTASGQELVLCSTDVFLSRNTQPIPLALDRFEGLLPAPLVLLVRSHSLSIELAVPPAGSKAPQLYVNAHEPSTKLQNYPIANSSKAASFDLGHRSTWVQRLFCYSISSSSSESELRLSIPEFQLKLKTVTSALRLATIHTADHKSGCNYLLCITVRI